MNLRFTRLAYYVGTPLVSAAHFSYDLFSIFQRALQQLRHGKEEAWITFGRFQLLIIRCGILVFVASFSAGMLMTLQFSAGVERFGGRLYVPSLVAMSIMKALGPMLASLMTASRSGGGLAAEVAGMKISQQTDAILALGSSVDRKIILPNLIALSIGLPCLTIIANFAGLLGGGLGAMVNLGLPLNFIVLKMIGAVSASDLWTGVLKTAPQGLLIGLVALHFGLNARNGTTGVGDATTSAIVVANLTVLVSDLLLTKLLWLIL